MPLLWKALFGNFFFFLKKVAGGQGQMTQNSFKARVWDDIWIVPTQPILQDSVKIWCSDLTGHGTSIVLSLLGLLKGFCVRCCARAEGVRKALGVLHQLIRLTYVWKAKPEYNPVTIYKTAITLLEIPEDLKVEWEMNNGWAKTGDHNNTMWRTGHTRDWCGSWHGISKRVCPSPDEYTPTRSGQFLALVYCCWPQICPGTECRCSQALWWL